MEEIKASVLLSNLNIPKLQVITHSLWRTMRSLPTTRQRIAVKIPNPAEFDAKSTSFSFQNWKPAPCVRVAIPLGKFV